MPSPKKPADRRQRRGTPDIGLVALPARPIEVPEPPDGLLAKTRRRWHEFWNSDLANAVDAVADIQALERLFELYDERERMSRAFRKQRFVDGSMGQPVLNPASRLVGQLDVEIRQLEDRFGKSPKSRLALGVSAAGLQRNLDALNASLLAGDDEDDPRLTVIEPSS